MKVNSELVFAKCEPTPPELYFLVASCQLPVIHYSLTTIPWSETFLTIEHDLNGSEGANLSASAAAGWAVFIYCASLR